MTWAWVARNVSSELKTSTKNAGSRSATVSRRRTAKSFQTSRRSFAARSEPRVLPGRRAVRALPRPAQRARQSGRRCPSVFPAGGRNPHSVPVASARAGAKRPSGLQGLEGLAVVLGLAEGALELARRGLGQAPGLDEHDVERWDPDGVADPVDDGVAERARFGRPWSRRRPRCPPCPGGPRCRRR